MGEPEKIICFLEGQLLPGEIPHGCDQGMAESDFLKGQVSNMQLPRCPRPEGNGGGCCGH